MLQLLDHLNWADGANGYILEREFLRGTGEKDPGIRKWIILIPQQLEPVSYWNCSETSIKVVKREVTTDARGNRRFNVFSEPRHRIVAEVIAQTEVETGATPDTLALRAEGTAVMILYPTVEEMLNKRRVLKDSEVAMGFALLFPRNQIREPLVFGVRDQTNPDAVVVTQSTP